MAPSIFRPAAGQMILLSFCTLESRTCTGIRYPKRWNSFGRLLLLKAGRITVSRDMIRVVLNQLREEGKLSCKGTGREAFWEKSGNNRGNNETKYPI